MPRPLPAPRVPGSYKVTPEDFVVVEQALYPPAGTGEHLWLRVRKRGIATMEAVARLADALRRPEREFGYAGLKDAFAITEQWISIGGVPDTAVASLQIDGLEVIEVTRHGNKLKLGHLRGNHFDILLRGVDAAHVDALRSNLASLARDGCPNYFGEQRFGKRGANLDKGMRILRGNPKQAARAIPKRLLRLLISAVQSEVFNRVLVQRLDRIAVILPGDVAILHRNGAAFAVQDVALEQPRCAAFEISPSGPLPGPKCLVASGEAGAMEATALAALDLDPALFGNVPHGTNDGERRSLRVQVSEPELSAESDGVRLRFALPKGSYATAVLRELLVEPPWFEMAHTD